MYKRLQTSLLRINSVFPKGFDYTCYNYVSTSKENYFCSSDSKLCYNQYVLSIFSLPAHLAYLAYLYYLVKIIRSSRRCANSRVAPKTFLVKLDVLITYISFMTNNILTFVVVYFFKTVSNQVIYPQPFPTHRF